MRFLRKDSISGFFALAAIAISGLCSIVLWTSWAFSHLQDFEAQAARERSSFVEAQRDRVRSEVNGVRDRIVELRARIDVLERAAIRSRVHDAVDISAGIFERLPPNVSRAEGVRLVAEALRKVRFSGGRGYYFMISDAGVSLLNPVRPDTEGRNLVSMPDSNGNFPFREFLAKARAGGGYVTYSWPRPDRAEGSFMKLSYVERFDQGAFIVGTGEYLEDIEAHQVSEALSLIETVRYDEAGYVFALAPDSTMLTHRAMPDLVGRRMAEEDNPLLRELFPRMADLVRSADSGFLEYQWPKQNGGLSTKVSYVARLPGWGWILGAGFHLDDLEAAVSEGREELWKNVRSQFLRMGAVMLAVIMVSLYLSRRFAGRIENDMRAFENFFAESAVSPTRVHGQLRFIEFRSIAESADAMSEERERIEEERKELRARLAQKRNLETIGTLAGGIAHDFNNILSAVIGYAELLERKPEDPERVSEQASKIVAAGMRARDLVGRILAFSTQAKVEMHPVELAPLIEESLSMVRASVPSTIEISAQLAPGMVVKADPTQLSQVVLNLLTNSATAMHESGGRVNVTLGPAYLAEERPPELADIPPGAYAVLTVADTGPGILPEVIGRIFEPFFTTHIGGKGSGLGLSVVHGVAKSHGGAVTVSSKPGQGATFSVYLPLSPESPAHKEPPPRVRKPEAPGTERIAFVDDEAMLVELAVERLGLLGYKVSGFTDPTKALEAIAADPNAFDILITDMTMPRLTGDVLARRVSELRPDLPIIISTGFSDSMNPQVAERLGVAALLMKPVTLAAIASKVREVLDRKKAT